MESPEITCDDVHTALAYVRTDNLRTLFTKLDLIDKSRVPLEYLFTLDVDEQVIAIRLCLLVYHATHGKEIPKELQFQAALACLKTDSLIVAGTGFGKTHIMALVILYNDNPKQLSLTVSPLNRLQITQVSIQFVFLEW